MGFRIEIVLRSFRSLHFLLSQLSAASRRWCRSSPPRLILPRFALRGVCLTFTHHTTSSSDRLSPPDRLIFRRWTFFPRSFGLYYIPVPVWSLVLHIPVSAILRPPFARLIRLRSQEKKKKSRYTRGVRSAGHFAFLLPSLVWLAQLIPACHTNLTCILR